MNLEGTVTAIAWRDNKQIALILLEAAYLSGDKIIPFEIAVVNTEGLQLREKVRVSIERIIH